MNIPTSRRPQGWTPQAWLEELTRRALPQRYPQGAPQKVRDLIDAGTGADRQARLRALFPHHPRHRRLCAREGASCARGAARRPIRRSAMCSESPPSIRRKTICLFARFISSARREPPDIDVDFEHERREEVIQHIYEKYGRERAGLAAAVISYRPRSALRDVAKVFGLSEDMIVALGSLQWGSHGAACRRSTSPGGPRSGQSAHRQVHFFRAKTSGFPRHLSQHVGGFVLTRGRLDETGADRQRRHAGPHLSRMGQGRHRGARPDEGRYPGAGHAHLHPQGV